MESSEDILLPGPRRQAAGPEPVHISAPWAFGSRGSSVGQDGTIYRSEERASVIPPLRPTPVPDHLSAGHRDSSHTSSREARNVIPSLSIQRLCPPMQYESSSSQTLPDAASASIFGYHISPASAAAGNASMHHPRSSSYQVARGPAPPQPGRTPTSESHLQQSPNSLSERLFFPAQHFTMQNPAFHSGSPTFPASPNSSLTTTPSRHSAQSSPLDTTRNRHVSFAPTSPTQINSPASSQTSPVYGSRRTSSSRRHRSSMASRQAPVDFPREDDDHHSHSWEGPYFGAFRRSSGSPSRPSGSSSSMTEAAVRELQLLRGAITTKMVASKSTLEMLQTVNVEDLPAEERVCVICYNDYGTKSPEGFKEVPLRLPGCGHVFGDRCIKVWLDDSDICPYCRDQLPAEPKRSIGSSRAFFHLIRMRGLNVQSGISQDFYNQIVESTDNFDIPSSQSQPSQTTSRRSPPEDEGDNVRRTRQRRSSSPLQTTQLPPDAGNANAQESPRRSRFVAANMAPRSPRAAPQGDPHRRSTYRQSVTANRMSIRAQRDSRGAGAATGDASMVGLVAPERLIPDTNFRHVPAPNAGVDGSAISWDLLSDIWTAAPGSGNH